MKKLFFSSSILFLFLYTNSAAQGFIIYGDKTFGGDDLDVACYISKGNENSLILCGRSSTNISGDKTDPLCDSIVANNIDAWILKIDQSFNIVWNKSMGGTRYENAPFLIPAGNNRMIFVCGSNSDSACEKKENTKGYPNNHDDDYWICMMDYDGNKIWDKTFGSFENDSYPLILRLSTGQFLAVGGSSDSPISGDKTVANYGEDDYWAVKFDSVGNKIWDNVYGGSGNETSTDDIALVACENGSFIIAGRTVSPVSGNISEPSYGSYDIWIIKVDSAGNKIWDHRYGGDSSNETPRQIIHSSDGGYILLGSTKSYQGGSVSDPPIGGVDVWVIKLDSMGVKQWDKRYGGTGGDGGEAISEAPGGGYIIAASSDSPEGDDITEPPYGDYDYWIFKIDDDGNKLWDKRFGGPGTDLPYSFVIMPDTSIFLAGHADAGTSAVKTDSGIGGHDYWVIHFKYSETATGINEFSSDPDLRARISPNPATSQIEIYFDETDQQRHISLLNTLGQTILHQTSSKSHLQLNISTLPSGIYFIELQNEKGSVIKKFVKGK